MRVVFIIGSPRSGSTLLDLVLGSHPDCASLGELRTVDKNRTAKEKQKRVAKGGLCATCGPDCNVWPDYDPKPPHWHKAAHELFGSPILIDSSKVPDWAKDCIPNLEDYRIIRLTRSGLDRFGSYKQRRGRVEAFEIKHWVKTEKAISKFLNDKEYMRLKYEDFAQRKGLDEICDYIGVDYLEDMWKFWEKKHHNIRGNTKTSMLVKMHHNMLRKPLSKTLQKFYNERGKSVKYVSKGAFLSDKDLSAYKKLGGFNVDKELGYN